MPRGGPERRVEVIVTAYPVAHTSTRSPVPEEAARGRLEGPDMREAPDQMVGGLSEW
ncbi:hypothetical protein DUHN55_21080 [Helicobacter pylori]